MKAQTICKKRRLTNGLSKYSGTIDRQRTKFQQLKLKLKKNQQLYLFVLPFSGDPDFLLRTDVWDHHCF